MFPFISKGLHTVKPPLRACPCMPCAFTLKCLRPITSSSPVPPPPPLIQAESHSHHSLKVRSSAAAAPSHLHQPGSLLAICKCQGSFPQFTKGGKPSRRGTKLFRQAGGPSRNLLNVRGLPAAALHTIRGSFPHSSKCEGPSRRGIQPFTPAGDPSRNLLYVRSHPAAAGALNRRLGLLNRLLGLPKSPARMA